MSALPLRYAAPQHTILKLYNTAYTLDPYHDRLASEGYNVLDGVNYGDALELAHRHHPQLVVVHDDPESGVDAIRWIELQHTDTFGWLATTPLIVLADGGRLTALRKEELPDRIVIVQRRADTLNQITRMVKYLLRTWGYDAV